MSRAKEIRYIKEILDFLNSKFTTDKPGKFCMAYYQADAMQTWVVVCRDLDLYLGKLMKVHLRLLKKKYKGKKVENFHVCYLGDGGIKALKMPNKPHKFFIGRNDILKELGD